MATNVDNNLAANSSCEDVIKIKGLDTYRDTSFII